MTSANLATGHVGLNVTDLQRSTAFYEAALGLEVLATSTESGRRYALLGSADALVLTLWEQSQGVFDTSRPGLHHLSFRVATVDDVERIQQRLTALDAKFLYDGLVVHSAGSASGGIFFEDPDGIRLEIFTAHVGDVATPVSDGPACGFF